MASSSSCLSLPPSSPPTGSSSSSRSLLLPCRRRLSLTLLTVANAPPALCRTSAHPHHAPLDSSSLLIPSLRPPRRLSRPLVLRCGLRSWGPATPSLRRKRRLCSAFQALAGKYERVPMDTAGAYQLIDQETGEKVIVWGGPEDDEFNTPSPETLSWNSPSSVAGQEELNKAHKGVGNKSLPSFGGSRGSFSKLKAGKVKAMMSRKSSPTSDGKVHDSRPEDAHYARQLPVGREKASSNSLRVNDDFSKEEVQGTTSFSKLSKRKGGSSDEFASMSKASASARGWGDVGPAYTTRTGQVKRPGKMPSDSGFFSRKSFKDLGCMDDMIESLKNQMFLRPSHIQAMAYEHILQGKSCIIVDQSGSGKTLAYLAPLVQCIRQEEILGLSKSSSRCPRVLILVPTAELASQVLNNCRAMSKYGVPFRSMVVTGGFRQKTQIDGLNQELDVLIATPGRFIYLLQEGFLQLTNLKRIVLDEVDILFGDEGFEQVLDSLVRSAPVTAQYLFVTATLPVEIYNRLVEIYPDCEVIMGPGMHRTSSGLEEVLVDCSGDDGGEKNPDTAFLNKKTALLQLVEESPVPKNIIFCNKIETCRKVENVLRRFDRKGLHIKALPFHAALEQEIRTSNLKEFFNPRSKDSLFLICTDRASRGIDFANVDHVILFDYPRDPSEYVRRVGRTARGVGGKGKAYIFVVGKQVSLAQRIIERNRKGHPIHDVPSPY